MATAQEALEYVHNHGPNGKCNVEGDCGNRFCTIGPSEYNTQAQKVFCALVDSKEDSGTVRQLSQQCDVIIMAPATSTLQYSGRTIKKPVSSRRLRNTLFHRLENSRISSTNPAEESGSCSKEECRILVAEDNAMNQIVIKKMLTALGYKDIDIVENGREAVEAARRRNYHIILMDCMVCVCFAFLMWPDKFVNAS
jgi:PleD family two-component response regulator